MRAPDWSPHPTVLRGTAYAACFVVVGVATWMVLVVLGRLGLALFPLGVALFATRALSIPAGWLRGRGWRPAPAAASTMVGALLVVAGIVAVIAPPMVEEFSDLGPTVDDGISEIEDWIVEDSPFDVTRQEVEEAEEEIVDRGREALASSEEEVTRGARAAVAGLAGLLLALILTFFALKDGPRFVAWMDEKTPEDKRTSVRAVAQASWDALGGYLRGAGLLGLVEAVVIGATMAIVGSGLVIPVMILTFAAAFVPIVGATVAGVIAVLVTLAAGGLVPALIVAVVAVLVQQLDNDLLAPWIYGKSLELHPATILVAITAGTALFGFVGTVLAVPLTATVVSSVIAVRDARAADHPKETAGEGPAPPAEPA
ncbi:AI-2E family transporter [Iamia sp. SCSIO 61187]|uniref:AI-2E family transporter n=1 Tax=Iamia sp. SCSIO 61187 TaxID=2722752 RepID=UPI001C62C3ED|nr:AI-2E family transporter [Iamia sp. SCSIO 61187]QYG94991.1 AI-2E family transporter [Iamia sp. SCSIO 61187]